MHGWKAADVRIEHSSSFSSQLPAKLHVRVASIGVLTQDIVGLELRAVEGGALPAFTAGAHIDLHLTEGLTRSYSLVNSQHERDRYEIAVKREANGRGGSAHIHDVLKPGQVIEITPPRNNFLLDEAAPFSVLFAGGIGVTPLVSMADRLYRIGSPFELHYGARSRPDAAFADRLEALCLSEKARLEFHLDNETGGRPIDFRAIAESAPAGSHFYCCGPSAMIDAFEAQLSHIPEARLHREYFSGSLELGEQGGFEVVLARSNRIVRVPEGTTILDALLDEGIEVNFSCMEGFCGSCRVGVIEGEPIHKDTVLGASDRALGKVIMICCSTVAGERLVLDL